MSVGITTTYESAVLDYLNKCREIFPHLMRRVTEVFLSEDLNSLQQICGLRYGKYSAELFHFGDRLSDDPLRSLLQEFKTREEARRPKHSTELHTRLMKGRQ